MSGSGVSGFRPRFFISQLEPQSPFQTPVDPDTDLCGRELLLGADDSYHALRVLRLGEGDPCEMVVGAAVYAASVTGTADPVKVRLTNRLEGGNVGAVYRIQVGVVQALARPALVDEVLEKGTEVGASFFVLVPTAGSPKRLDPSHAHRLARWRRIAQEAAKQSKQVAVPPVEVASSVGHALDDLGASGTFSLVLEPTAPAGVHEILSRPGARFTRLALWVGPEGGWSAAEREQFSAADVERARLGRSVLRTETAGPVAVAVARLALGDW
jgi:16S rRNA (uracil1498-N3)-methyltransferase